MEYKNVLVAVSNSADSQRLVDKAVSIVRPYNGKISLLTLTTDPEMYNNFAAPMLGDLRILLQEEARRFMAELQEKADYPTMNMVILHGELADSLTYACKNQHIDLVICGHHSNNMMNKIFCSANRLINASSIDVLIVPL
ncbi:universal stress protein UspC [Yersinia ruckeri]|uniref:universal stress protein UspC n=1 Tax=Yersinia ruckeri TaxID=29486 RepID=UPI0005367451|nr:universal stress protein UspC [Yersinia ruckeri]AKA37621.1 universal stress protein UspC [Yersinia ruckeri]AUQ42697.1 universal stress protein UspC [Yersinia ruckeri]EKN4184002.1 universal stress protein UspC [Yersinia ruckeri]EKN4199159.1 universal stress protein UspC [Yersinia ruckeri]EKN4205618.1 universal stress protein UspC [Yersinia ruckeri]